MFPIHTSNQRLLQAFCRRRVTLRNDTAIEQSVMLERDGSSLAQ